MNSRRNFIRQIGLATLGATVLPHIEGFGQGKKWFDISLAQWSLHRMIKSGSLDNLDFPTYSADTFGIYAVEYVNQFFKDKGTDKAYLKALAQRSKDVGVKNVLIMIDGEGSLGDTAESKRLRAVDNHYKWIDAAHALGCHAVRVNAGGNGKPEEVKSQVVKSLSALAAYGKKGKISVIVENHGGLSSDGSWLADVLKTVDHKYCGSLPDFGNFYEYDRYQGVSDLMPYAKGVSAKTYDFDENGMETLIDFEEMLRIVKDAGYRGYIGVEYEGKGRSEQDGIRATKALLERYQWM